MKKKSTLLIVLILLCAMAGGAYLYAKNALEAQIKEEIAQSNALNPNAKTEFGDLSANPLLRSATLTDVKVTLKNAMTLDIEKIKFSDLVDDSDHKHVHMHATGISGQSAPMVAAMLAMLGYTQPIKADMVAEWDVKDGVFDISECSLGVKEMGRFNVVMNGAGIDMSLLDTKNPEEVEALAKQMIIRKLSLSYTDDSLFDRIITFQASQKKCSKEEILARHKMLLQALAAGKPDPNAQKLQQALTQFMDNPGTLTMTVSVTKDIPMSQLTDDPALMEQFVELEATATQP